MRVRDEIRIFVKSLRFPTVTLLVSLFNITILSIVIIYVFFCYSCKVFMTIRVIIGFGYLSL